MKHRTFTNTIGVIIVLVSIIVSILTTTLYLRTYKVHVVEETVTVYRYPTSLQPEFEERKQLLFRTEGGDIVTQYVPDSLYESLFSGERVVVKVKYLGKRARSVYLRSDCL